jgi:hypothetical protein
MSRSERPEGWIVRAIVPMDQVRGFEAPVGQCPYASMRCIAGG